jgi:hypothetical protein
MKRYTGKSLEADLVSLNQTLERIGSEMRLVIGYRYGYTAVDIATVEQLKVHCQQRNLETGTPKECLNACNAFVGSEALNVLLEAAKS